MALINCPKCNYQVSEKASKCVNCGCQIKECVCVECGCSLSLDDKSCPNCGCPVDDCYLIGDANKLHCPYCNSNNIQVQLVSYSRRTGCLSVLLYIILAITIVGIPFMILILLLRGKTTTTSKYYVCQNCGKTFNNLL